MPQRSIVSRTPGAEALVRAGMRAGATIDQITDDLAGALPDAGISRSAVGRYTKAQRAVLAAAERTDLLCGAIERALTQRPAGQSAAMRAEALRIVIFDRQMEGAGELEPREVRELEAARKLVEETLALERRNAGVDVAPGDAGTTARAPLSHDVEATIRAQMEGAAEPPAQ